MARNIILGAGAGATLTAIVMSAVMPTIEQFEGTKHVAYRDIGGILSVCSGHTGPDVVVGKVYTKEQCQALTQADIEKAEIGILKVSPHLKYHPMQLAAAISFSYNVGLGDYARSSVARNFNAGDFNAGCAALFKYTYAGGKYSQGLWNRRKAEYDICVSTLTPKGLVNVGNDTSSAS